MIPTQLEPLYVLAVSAKRYALANRRSLPSGGEEWIIRKASGHGLGHITAPAYDQTALPPHPAVPLDKKTGKPVLEQVEQQPQSQARLRPVADRVRGGRPRRRY